MPKLGQLNPETREEVACGICGIIFDTYKCFGRKFCSAKCFHIHKKGLPLGKRGEYEDVICEYCGVKFNALSHLHRRFCSQECKGRWQIINLKGSNNPNWQNAPVASSRRIKRTVQWPEWRDSVFHRDSFTCQICNRRGGELEPHHLKSKQVYPELAFTISNGVTLCKRCHRDLHRHMPANQVIMIEEYPIVKEVTYALSNA